MKSLVSMARKRAEWWYDRQSPKVKGKGARLRGGVSTVQKAAPLLKDMEFLSTSHRSASHRRRVCGCGWADPRCIFVALLTLHNQGEACAPPLLPAFEVLKFLTLTFVACIQHRRQKGNTGPTNSYHGTPGSINPTLSTATHWYYDRHEPSPRPVPCADFHLLSLGRHSQMSSTNFITTSPLLFGL